MVIPVSGWWTRLYTGLAFPAVCVLFIGNEVAAQALVEERRAVLRSSGNVKTPMINMLPTLDTAGRIAIQPLSYEGAEALRVQFIRTDDLAATGTWHIEIHQNDKLKESIHSEDMLAGSYWSGKHLGSTLNIELHSSVIDNPVVIQIAGIAVIKKPPVRQSITGEDDLSPITAHMPWVKEIGRSVARLEFIGDDKEVYTCTGFIVAPQLVMTNQHCLSSEAEMKSAVVEFDFDSAAADTVFTRLKNSVATSYTLDYTLAEMVAPIDRPALNFRAVAVTATQDLMIIQHPGGKIKHVSVIDCEVGRPNVVGRKNPASDFEHLCDTETGSSGAPVIDRQQRQVVGLHHLGFEEDNNNLLNRAVHIGLILADLQDKKISLELVTDSQ